MKEQTDTPMGAKPAARMPLHIRLLPLLLLFAVAALFLWFGGLDYISLQKFAENRDVLIGWVADSFLTSILIYMAIYAMVVALSLPVAGALTLAGGFLFGAWIGGPATVIAATLGATLIFILARTALAESLSQRAGPWLNKLRGGFQDNALSYLLFLRLVPAFPFWLVNLAPALLGVSLRDYVIATFLGIIPGTFALALTGAGLGSVLEAHQEAYENCLARNAQPSACSFDLDPASLITTELILALAALGIIALIPVIVKRFWKR